jgi:hypothetical protein
VPLSASILGLVLGLGSTAPTFSGPAARDSHDGSLLLEWEEDESAQLYEVERAGEGRSAQTVYSGHLPSAHVSGMLPGNYQFRLRAQDREGNWSDWSPSVAVKVQYHPMGAVFASLGLGALVFLMTAGFVVSRSTRKDLEA